MSNFILAPEGLQLRDVDVWGPIYDAKTYGTIMDARIVRVRRIGNQGETWEIEFDDAPGITGLVPAEQTGLPEGTPVNAFVGSVISVKVMEINRKEGIVACSRKEVVNISLSKLLAAINVGQEISSIVKFVSDRNVYLDIGGGVIIRLPAEKARLSDGVPLDVQYRRGGKVNIIVTNLSKEDRGIEVEPIDPWERWTFSRGEVLSGTVVAVRDTAVFVSVKPGVIGMAPYKAADEFVHGDRLEFQVNKFDATKRKLHLIEWDPKKVGQRKREKYRAQARRNAARQSRIANGEDKIIIGVFSDIAVGAEEKPGIDEE
ncbi:RNA binding S1 domain protein [Desulforamulus reducens MI-1]|uniref:RNA binding S1 domain protein n=1 Tax=Desulforamulus reducens (strain ATCC BAA-1160 / DSM 100696 / MI-1) TaxID=349161 RepID=A4J359_DESRM|nr:RNA-binding protein S1 [Desulforamulus reducens]ABO49512.1 RNA binding S1 domain protein [Desulforamulus reducens MI-1]